jgi:hypothetical protein
VLVIGADVDEKVESEDVVQLLFVLAVVEVKLFEIRLVIGEGEGFLVVVWNFKWKIGIFKKKII